MKKLNLFLILCVVFGAALPARAATVNVVTTTEDLKSITEHIGKDKVKVTSLGRGSQNYHFLAAKPSFMIKARNADLFIRNGLDLEIGYESLILEGARNRNIQSGQKGYLDASNGIIPLDVPEKLDRSMGDIHAGGNPHYWIDPLNAKIIAHNIADRLSDLNPEDKIFFQKNLEDFNRRIDEKMKEWAEALAPYKGEKIMSYHQSWTYFAHRFDFDIIGELEPKPGVPPSGAYLKKVIDEVKEHNVKVILNENIYKVDAAQYVAGETGASVVVAPISVGGTKR
ncbi:MAG: zinc ABC transporter substrate-binding protein, partial [Candidatus Omnitrophica bacterium]|nr:zinc ABC transporter substrate-binding protein [Candidatus Omnitrophota bacterium]